MKSIQIILILFIGVINPSLFAQPLGPEKGSLVIVGGNARIAPEVFKEFIDLAGGPTVPIKVEFILIFNNMAQIICKFCIQMTEQ